MLFVALTLSLTLLAVSYGAAEEIRSIHSFMMNPPSLETFIRMTSVHAVATATDTAAVSNNLREGLPNLEAAAPTSYFGYLYYSTSKTCDGASSYGFAIGLDICFLSNDYYYDGVRVYYKSAKYTKSGSTVTQNLYSDTACNTLLRSSLKSLVCYPTTSYYYDPTAPGTLSVSFYSSSSLNWPANGLIAT